MIDQGEGLAGAGGHRDQHLPLAAGDGLLDGGVRLHLVGTQERMVVGRGEPRAGGVEVAAEHFLKGGRSVKGGDAPRGVERMPHIVEPEDLAVRGVEEGDVQAAEVEWGAGHAAGVTLGLAQDVLWPQRDLLGLDDAEGAAGDEKGVIGGAVVGWEFGPGVASESGGVLALVERGYRPTGRCQQGVNAFHSRGRFGFGGHRSDFLTCNLPFTRWCYVFQDTCACTGSQGESAIARDWQRQKVPFWDLAKAEGAILGSFRARSRSCASRYASAASLAAGSTDAATG